MTRRRWFLAALVVSAVGGTLVFAQRYYDRRGVPDWQPDKEFAHDVFTFVRIQYSSGYGGGGFGPGRGRRGFGGRGGRWATDYPDSDLNFSYRLQQLTSLEVNPDGLVLELTDPELFNYPFIYIVEPGYLVFTDEEVVALRNYLLNGGFLMVDDFWGQEEWYNFYYEMKRVFPDREPVDLPLSHPIFRAVFELKEKPQVPSVGIAIRGRPYGITWEREDAREPHYRALFDDKGRMMAIICHNTDLGDGWEEEGTDEWFFREFSEKKAYPMGINIVFYAMTR
jgi:hypothetical protein